MADVGHIFYSCPISICEYNHPSSVREVTVKTFSPALGVSRPGFQILSLIPGDPTDPTVITHADMSCELPNQLGIYWNVYGAFGSVDMDLVLSGIQSGGIDLSFTDVFSLR